MSADPALVEARFKCAEFFLRQVYIVGVYICHKQTMFIEPGMGTTFGYLCSIHAKEICAGVASFITA